MGGSSGSAPGAIEKAPSTAGTENEAGVVEFPCPTAPHNLAMERGQSNPRLVANPRRHRSTVSWEGGAL